MRKIHLHGHLAKYGKTFELDVLTAGEAIRALNANFPRFREDLEIGHYRLVRGDEKTGFAIDLEEVNDYRLGNADLHIIPVAEGAKRGGILKAILGVALVGAALFFSGGTLAGAIGASGTLLGSVSWASVAFIGLGLAIAGASSLISDPDKKGEDEKKTSHSLSGPTNTYEQGNPVPLVYGEVITGGQVISAGIDIEQQLNHA
ncbi:tail assembly protein [Aureimonas sp. AU40]|uniref:tail assembly protein n=1 Tax=Aureimonas sp. AU40 TaxID=1637747 RepID=UPI000785FEC9|nr:tail assembly protein [Aureimonas sp. AU40]